MPNDNWDTSGIGDPKDSWEYQDYEIPYEARLNLKEIERCLRNKLYASEEMCRDHIDLLENLDAEMTVATENERRIGRHNVTLQHDQTKVRNMLKELRTLLRDLDPSQYD